MVSQSFKFRFPEFLAVLLLPILVTMFSASLVRAVTINEFPLPSIGGALDITAGPDGNLWFTTGDIDRMTPDGIITMFTVPSVDVYGQFLGGPDQITAGPDGNLWFTETQANVIGRITPEGIVKQFPLPMRLRYPYDIAAGPDGNLWFTELYNIGRITTNGIITEFPLPIGSDAGDITAGSDGNLWFTDINKIGRITPDGAITEFPLPLAYSGDGFITSGPGGNLWFSGDYSVGRITPDGVITEFHLPNDGRFIQGITSGPDGNLWFTEMGEFSSHLSGEIGRMTPDGLFTEFPLSDNWGLQGITVGPDSNIWFIEGATIGQVVLDNNDIISTPVPTPAATFATVYADPINSANYFTDTTSKNTVPISAVPLWVWDEGPTAPLYSVNPSDPVHVSLNVGDYSAPVDVYVGIEIPAVSTDIYLFDTNGGLHSLSTEGLVKYKSSVTSTKMDILTLTENEMSQLKSEFPGTWYFFALVVPAGNIDKGIADSYYLWEMTY